MDKRWQKAMHQLQRLRHVPATLEGKVKAIHAKVYGAALYGIEAEHAQPAKVAKLAAAVIDVFRSKNNDHNAVRVFTTITEEKNDSDPMAQIFARRVLQVRRTCSNKKKGRKERLKRMISKYAVQNSKDDKWPVWFHPVGREEIRNHMFPLASNRTPQRRSMTRSGRAIFKRWGR